MVGLNVDAESKKTVYLAGDRFFGQSKLGNTGPQQSTDFGSRFEYLDLVAKTREMIGGGQAGGTGSDNCNPFFAFVDRFWRYLAIIAGIAFHLAHVDGAVQFDAVAVLHTRGRAGPPADRRERCRAQEYLERFVGFVIRQRVEESLHIIAGRANVVTGRNHLLSMWLLGRPLSRLDSG